MRISDLLNSDKFQIRNSKSNRRDRFGNFGFLWNSFWHLLLNVLWRSTRWCERRYISHHLHAAMRLLTVPLTMKALRSSRNMQQIQTLIQGVQKKYARTAEAARRVMKIYASMASTGGKLLPMLIQVAYLIGLYSALTFVLPTFHWYRCRDSKRPQPPTWSNSDDTMESRLGGYRRNFGQAFCGCPTSHEKTPCTSGRSSPASSSSSRAAWLCRCATQPAARPQTKMMQNMMQSCH